MADFSSGDYTAAYTELRNAAFGFVEQVDKFETVQAYAVLAAHRLGHDADARDALLRITAAETITPRFRSIKLPDELRVEIDTTAAWLLTRKEAALLGVPSQTIDTVEAAKPRVLVPTPTKRPSIPITAPQGPGTADTSPPIASGTVSAGKPPIAPLPIVQEPPAEPAPRPSPPPPAIAKDVRTSLTEAEGAVAGGDLAHAKVIYDELLNGIPLAADESVRVAEGLYRVRDYSAAVRAFETLHPIRRALLRYHYAVSLYETGHYSEAKRELALSLPYITKTPDVRRYRAKIEGAFKSPPPS